MDKWVYVIHWCNKRLLYLLHAQNYKYIEITWGYFCNKVTYWYSSTITHCSLPYFWEDLSVLSFLKIFFACPVEQWRRVCIPGTWSFFQTWSYPHFWYWKKFSAWYLLKTLEKIISMLLNILCLLKEGGGRTLPCCLLFWPFVPCKLELLVLFILTSCAIFPPVSSVKIPKLKTMAETDRNTTPEKPFWSEQSSSSELPGSDLVKRNTKYHK